MLPTKELFRVSCESAAGVVGQNTHVSCCFKNNSGDKNVTISHLYVNKRGEENPVFKMSDGEVKGDPRFKLPSVYDPSLLITNTAVSDEGWYDSTIVTNRGVIQDGTFQISVTALYSPPSISSRPEKLVEGGPAELNCSAGGGHPEGTIRWRDSNNRDWTRNATQQYTTGEDKLVHMSSTLSLSSFYSRSDRFWCDVYNSKGVKEGLSTFPDPHKDGPLLFDVTTVVLLTVLILMVIVISFLRLGYRRHILKRIRKRPQIKEETEMVTIKDHSPADA